MAEVLWISPAGVASLAATADGLNVHVTKMDMDTATTPPRPLPRPPPRWMHWGNASTESYKRLALRIYRPEMQYALEAKGTPGHLARSGASQLAHAYVLTGADGCLIC